MTHGFEEILARFLVHYSAKSTPVPTSFSHLVVTGLFSSNSAQAFCSHCFPSVFFSLWVCFLMWHKPGKRDRLYCIHRLLTSVLWFKSVIYDCRGSLFSWGWSLRRSWVWDTYFWTKCCKDFLSRAGGHLKCLWVFNRTESTRGLLILLNQIATLASCHKTSVLSSILQEVFFISSVCTMRIRIDFWHLKIFF